MKKNIMLIVGLSICAVLFFGSHGVYAEAKQKHGGMINVGLNTDLVGVDPHVSGAVVNAIVLGHVFEPLVAYGENLEHMPVLAESWDIAPDFMTYTFHLRKGRLFHNGKEMHADDVKYSVERMMDPKTGCPRRSQLKIEQIEVLDDYTVRFHMKEADASLLDVLAYTSPVMAIIPEGDVERQGGSITHPVGTGPFKFVEWKPDRYVLMERFDQYRPIPGPMSGMGGAKIVYVDKLKFIPIPEESVATMALLNKEIDLLQYVPFKNVKRFREDYTKRGIVLQEIPGLSWYQIFLSCTNPVTKNRKFRKAVAYAVDLDTIGQAATRGYCVVNPSPVAVKNLYYTPRHRQWYTQDVAKAKQLLKEAGYKGGEVVLQTTKKYAMMFDQAVAVHAQLQEAGINARLVVLEWPILLSRMYSGDFQMQSFGIGARPDPTGAYVFLKPTGFLDQYPRMKGIIAEASKTMDFEKRKILFEEAQDLVREAVPMINLFNYINFNAHWKYVKGFKIFATNYPRLWGVWLDK